MTIQKLISFARAFQTFGPSLELQQNLSSQLWSPMPSLAQWQCWSLSRAKFEFWWSTLQKDGPIVWLLLQNHLLGCSYLKKNHIKMSISRTLNNNLHRRQQSPWLSFVTRQIYLDRKIDCCCPLPGKTRRRTGRFFFWDPLESEPFTGEPLLSGSIFKAAKQKPINLPTNQANKKTKDVICQWFAWDIVLDNNKINE